MTPISLSEAHSRGLLTEEGHCARACNITLVVIGVLAGLVAVAAGTYIFLPFYHITDLAVYIASGAFVVGGTICTFAILIGLLQLKCPLSQEDTSRYILNMQLKQAKTEEQVDQLPLLHRIKSILGCCFHQVIKESSFQTF